MPATPASALPRFNPPANQDDLADPTAAEELRVEWSNNINRWTNSAILGDPWTSLNDSFRTFYYNPLSTDLTGGASALIAWIAFPNRILLNFPNASFKDQMGYAEGVHTDGSFGPPPPVNGAAYSPAGPRGWQDEYCEWISTRDETGKITRVDFTCENPEYWFTLWRSSPQTVLEWYQKLVSSAVVMEDLYLRDSKGNPVIDRSTGFAAYNPINKWNNQPSAGQTTGAVHLISPPNTLGAEIYLAAGATLLRDSPPGMPVTDPGKLIQCSRYGRAGRNSDPHIGAAVNNIIIGGGTVVSLEDPVGLYIQMPDFSAYQLPDDPNLPPNAQASDCWNIVRGVESLPGHGSTNFILHATFEIPAAWKAAGVTFTVGDITIQGSPVQYGAQIAQTFQIGLCGLAVPTSLPPEAPQTCSVDNPNPLPAPQQLQDLNLYLARSTSAAVTKLAQGSTTPNIVLLTFAAAEGASITVLGDGVSVVVTDFQDVGDGYQAFTLTITVDETASLGDRSVGLVNPGGQSGPAAPGMLTVVPSGSLPPPDQAHSPQHALLAAEALPSQATPADLSKIPVRKKMRY